MLIFLAGYEIEFDKVRGDTLKRSLWAWGISLAVGLGVASALSGWSKAVYIGTALTSTTRLVLHGAAPESAGPVLEKVEAMGFGFLVPVFFVVTGIEFDLAALLSGGRALLLLPVFLLLFLAVRGLPVYVVAPRDLPRRDRRALTLFASTALPLVVAITTIGVEDKVLRTEEAAALVGAGMLSVLLFPLAGLRLRRMGRVGPQEAVRGSESW